MNKSCPIYDSAYAEMERDLGPIKAQFLFNKFGKTPNYKEMMPDIIQAEEEFKTSSYSKFNSTTHFTQKDVLDTIDKLQDEILFNEENHTYQHKLTGEYFQSVTNAMTEIGYGPKEGISEENLDKMDRAARIGTVIHNEAENYFKNTNIKVNNGIELSNAAKNAFIGRILNDKFKKDTNVQYRSEVVVFDPINKIAGTIDLIVVNSDGTVEIYDFKTKVGSRIEGNKFIESGGFKYYTSDKFGKSYQNKFNLQLTVYKKILHGHGVRVNSKSVIGLDTTMNGNTIHNIQLSTNIGRNNSGIDTLSSDNEDYKQILSRGQFNPTETYMKHDKLTELKRKLINTLLEKKHHLERKGYSGRAGELQEIIDTISNIKETANMISMFLSHASKDIESLYKISSESVANNTQTIKKLEYWADSAEAYDILDDIAMMIAFDPEYKSDAQLLAEVNRLKMLRDQVKVLYKDYAENLIVDRLSKESTYIADKRRLQYELDYNKLSKEDKAKITKPIYIDRRFKEEENSLEAETKDFIRNQLKTADKDISTFRRWADNLLDSPDSVVGSIMKIVTKQFRKAEKVAEGRYYSLVEDIEKLEKVSTNNVLTKSEDFYKPFIEEDEDGNLTQNIVVKYNAKFRKEYYEMLDKVASIDDPIIKRNIRRNFWDERAPYNKVKYKSERETVLKQLAKDGLLTEDEAFKVIENYNKRLSEQKDLKELVNLDKKELIIQKLFELKQDLRELKDAYTDKKYKQLENLRKSNPEDPKILVYDQLIKLIKDGNRNLPDMYKLGGFFENRLPGIAKEFEDQVKSNGILYALKNKVTTTFNVRPEDTERIDQQFKVSTNEKELQYLPVYYTNDIELANQNYDLGTILYKFYKMSEQYVAKKEILPEVEFVRTMLNQRTKKAVDKKGNPIMNLLTKNSPLGVEEAKAGMANNIADQFSDFVNAIFYGQLEKDQGSFNLFGFELDKAKAASALSSFTSLNLLGFNWVQGINNVVLGDSYQYIESLAGEYISISNFRKGAWKYDHEFINGGLLADISERRPKNIVNLLMNHFGIDYKTDDQLIKNNSKVRDLADTSAAYSFMKMGEHFMKGRYLLGSLYERKVHDKNGKEYNAIDLFTVKDGKLVFDEENKIIDFDEDTQLDFGNKVGRQLSALHGEYGELGRVALEQGALGRMVLAYRKWIVPGIKKRFYKMEYREVAGDFREGMYITYANFFSKFFKEMFAHGLTSSMLQWDNLTDHQKANIKRTNYEIAMFLAATLLATFLINMKGDSDDDKLLNTVAYQAYRYKLEMSFYVNVPGAWKMLSTPAASMSTIQSFAKLIDQLVTDPTEIYERTDRRGELKIKYDLLNTMPMLRQLYRYSDMGSELSWLQK